MDRQDNITLSSSTNFLESGALLRHKGKWTLIEGPFSPAKNSNKPDISVFCPDFYDLEKSPFWVGTQVYELSTEKVREFCQAYLAKNTQSAVAGKPWQEPEKADFESALHIIQTRIAKGEITKAVPVVFAKRPQSIGPTERARMILQLSEAPENLYVYGFWQKGEGLLGATPEVLYSVSEGTLETMALAGTCPKTESSSRASLLLDQKEMQEHQFVIEDLREVLSSLGQVEFSETKILELPTLFHLKTDIQVQLKQPVNFAELIKNLHPTAALGVAPRRADFKWMANLPGQVGRGAFGAPFAILRPLEALCLVAIRNIQWNESFSQIGSGCGIVAASELEREWRELYQKRLSVKKILGLEI